MAGRTTTLQRAADSSNDKYQEHQQRRKTARRVANPAPRRTARHRQAKLMPSVETYTPAPELEPTPAVISDSESDFKDLDAIMGKDEAAAAKAKRLLSNQPRRETATADPSRVSSEKQGSARNQPDEESTDQASQFNPSAESDRESTESDESDHPRKRSRLDNGQASNSKIASSTSVGRQSERYDPRESSSKDVHTLLPTSPVPSHQARLARGYTNSGGRSRLRGVRVEPGPSQIPTGRPNRGGRVVGRQDPGEGSSRAVHRQATDSVQYLHSLTRNMLRAAPPPEMTSLVDRTKQELGTRAPSSGQAESSLATRPNETHDSARGFSRDFRTMVVHFHPPSSQVVELHTEFVFNLADCRNERNGLDGTSSKSKQKAVDPSQKCQSWFKFRRNCDPAAGGSCGACTRTKSKCIPRNTQKPTAQEIEEPPAAEFSGSKLWEKCRSCAALDKQCIFNEDEDDCQNCKKRGWKCQPQMAPKPKKRKPYGGRFQDVKLKCHYCVKYKAHCDGANPKCGHCAKWNYKCYPPGTEQPKKVPKDEKCKRCRQLKLACHENKPCPRCVEQGIECGMTAKEEKLHAAFLGD
ncbi:uncharacterized protein PAC_08568 [Phialocephala subalpina]|uniref:Zn(2)-C6 fungal-type domain-containing protein n=1 Tax=Phialocephala subalpina TaxID=576137 RepID=A0A1L7X0X9_9HELO|nr:uncharacterized protein PAC_08568 [Phialocephala subalpina]